MAMNRIQFQPGPVLAGLLQQYDSEAACTRALRRARWPKEFACPRCGGQRYDRCANLHGERMWQCSTCRHQTSLISDTVFASTKLPLRTRFLALSLLTQSKANLPALELIRHLGYDRRKSQRDAYLGGERNGGKLGRGSENKRPFAIAVDLSDEGHPRHAVITPVSGFATQALTDWTRLHLRQKTEVHSVWHGAFRAVIESGHAHTIIDSVGGRAATEAGGMR